MGHRPKGRPPDSEGRPAAASREDVHRGGALPLPAGRQRIDVQAIAAEIGVGRATVYRWFGSRDNLIGEVVIRATEPVLAEARAGLEGKGGPGLLDTFDRFNRRSPMPLRLRAFVEQERDAALRLVASGAGMVQPRVVELITGADHRGGRGRDLRPADRAGDPRLRDRQARPGLPLQRRGRRGSAATSTGSARSRRRFSGSGVTASEGEVSRRQVLMAGEGISRSLPAWPAPRRRPQARPSRPTEGKRPRGLEVALVRADRRARPLSARDG